MQNVILVVHIIACIVMTIVIMLQKSEGGALGIGGGGGGLMTGRSAAGALVRVTMIFGGIFFITSLGLTTLANRTTDNRSAIERAVGETNPDAVTGPRDLLDPTAPLLGTPAPSETPDADTSAAVDILETPASPATPTLEAPVDPDTEEAQAEPGEPVDNP